MSLPEPPSPILPRWLAPVAVVALSTALGGCRSEAKPWAGVYAVERVTTNEVGCDAEGPTSNANVQCLFLRDGEFFGVRVISGGTATSLDRCRKLFAGEIHVIEHALSFDSGLDSAEMAGELGTSAMPEDGICHSNAEVHRARRLGPDRVRFEVRRTNVDYPGKSYSDCGTRDSVKAAVGKPCSRLVVIEARRLDP